MKVKESEGKWKCTQLRLTLYDPTDYTVHGILQARTLEWVAFPFFRGSSQPRDQTQVSRIAGRFFTILEWVAYPFSSRSSRPRNWTGVSCIEGRFFINWAIREALIYRDCIHSINHSFIHSFNRCLVRTSSEPGIRDTAVKSVSPFFLGTYIPWGQQTHK